MTKNELHNLKLRELDLRTNNTVVASKTCLPPNNILYLYQEFNPALHLKTETINDIISMLCEMITENLKKNRQAVINETNFVLRVKIWMDGFEKIYKSKKYAGLKERLGDELEILLSGLQLDNIHDDIITEHIDMFFLRVLLSMFSNGTTMNSAYLAAIKKNITNKVIMNVINISSHCNETRYPPIQQRLILNNDDVIACKILMDHDVDEIELNTLTISAKSAIEAITSTQLQVGEDLLSALIFFKGKQTDGNSSVENIVNSPSKVKEPQFWVQRPMLNSEKINSDITYLTAAVLGCTWTEFIHAKSVLLPNQSLFSFWPIRWITDVLMCTAAPESYNKLNKWQDKKNGLNFVKNV